MKKYIYYIGIVAIALIGATSCQMQEEMWGKKNNAEQVGVLQLKVEATAPTSLTTKADNDNTVDTKDFAVLVKGKEGTDVKDVERTWEKYTDVPEKVTLPIGEYVVSSHTAGELKKTLNYPYFAGEKALTVSNVDNSVTVQCKMKNSRIQLNYSDEFKASFSKWNIMITDKSNQALLYDQSNLNPDAVYWYFEEETPSVTVHITATTTEGNTVTSEQTFVKDDASEKYTDVDTEFFTGGDALIIDMKPTEATTGQIGIDIKVSIVFENHDTPVRIDVSDKEIDTPTEPETPTDPETPSENLPSLTCPAFETGIAYSISAKDWPTTTDIEISTPSGIKSLLVVIDGGNPGFSKAVSDLKFTGSGRDLVGDEQMVSVIGSVPQQGATNYVFSIASFYPMMNIYGTTVDADVVGDDGKVIGIGNAVDGKNDHVFKVKVIDMANNEISKELKVTISK